MTTFDDLTDDQKELHTRLCVRASSFGTDLRDQMLESGASAADKAAVAEVFGGPGAGEEFLQ